MRSSTRTLSILALVALAAIAGWFLFLRGGGKRPAAPAPAASSTDDPWSKAGAPRPKEAAPPEPGAAPVFQRDADPIGGLRLEGQVLDDHDKPVGGAEVWLGSMPPRSAKTEDDGSFAFDKLVGRVYSIEARKGEDVGGPVTYTLTATSDPAVVRLRRGETLTVIVTGAADGKAIANAQVEARGLMEQHATTGADGKATLHGVPEGWISLAVSASGFAPAHTVTEVKEGGADARVQLDKGAAVSGKVVDEAGAPVAKAHVLARAASTLLPLEDATRDGAVTDDKGHFTIASVPAGSFRFIATDDEHAPGSSSPITVDGVTAQDGVQITMKAAAVLAGRVITKDQQPAPYATVKVTPKDWGVVGGPEAMAASERQVVTDQDGHFSLHGLPRAAIRVRAESDAAASAIADVDLTGGSPPALLLVLDVSGTIAGIVVDGDGQPVAEAQVTAMTDVLAGGDLDDLAISGFTQATTDGGGHFAVHGLPPGAYRVYAHRTGGSMQQLDQKGTPAHPGDTNMRIVLPSPGGIKGKVALDDGTPVKAATVETGFASNAAVVGGAFALRDLPPGTYDLKIHGADFAELTKTDVAVEAGKVTDVGTITVHRGRRVTGRVITSDGSPAAGAKVAIGKLLLADGRGLGMSGLATDEQMGMRSTTTDRDGAFTIIGVGVDGGSILADHPTLGRSDGATIPQGTDDPPPITLRLHGFGSLAGKVTLAGAPVGSATLMVSEKSGGASSIVVTTGADGTYLIEKIPEGQHHATVMRTSGFGAATAGADCTVVAGQRTTLDIDIPQGDIALTIEVRGLAGATVNAAEVLLMGGTVSVKNGKELQDAFLHGSGGGGGGVKIWLGGPQFPTFEKLTAGPYSVCTLPITGDLTDPRITRALQDQGEQLAVYCTQMTLKPDPPAQRFVHEVPAMKALPPPT